MNGADGIGMLTRLHGIVVALGVMLSMSLSGCGSGQRAPDLAALYETPARAIGVDRTPVVVIPGILGSKLADAPSGTSVWGAFTYGAADADTAEGARFVALPMGMGMPLSALRDEVYPTEALDRIEVDTLGVIRGIQIEAYAGILRTLGAGKYRDEALARGAVVDYGGLHWTCFQCGYDWRRDISESAATLGEKIRIAQESARQAQGLDAGAPLRVDVVAHSMGGLVLRYYLRYGEIPLPDDGSVPTLTWAGAEHVRRAVLVGTPNAGSALAIEQLVDGWALAPITPNYRPAVLGTMPAVYQLLPRVRHARVIAAASGEPVDLYDPAEWKRYGWGLAGQGIDKELSWLLPEYDAESRRRIGYDHLAKCLAKAEQLHRALDTPAVPPQGTEIVLFAGDSEPTLDVVLVDPDGSIRTGAESSGDGTVTRDSALMDERVGRTWMPRVRSPIAWSRVQFLSGDHLGMTNDTSFVDNLLYLLLEAPGPDGADAVPGGR